jgi:hypothetical protein
LSNSQEESEKKTISRFTPRLIYVKILILICLIVLSMITLKPIQTALSGTISSIRTNLIGKLETATGLRISYSSIRPAFLSSFDIRNLKFYKDDAEILTVSRARFYFSIFELVVNRKIAFKAIQIDRPVLRVDMKRDRDIFDNFKNLSSSQENNTDFLEQIRKFLPQKADYRVRGGSASVSSSSSLYKIENVNLNIRGDAQTLFLDTKFGTELRFAGLFDRTVVVKTGMDINGNYSPDSKEISAQIALSDLICSQENVKKSGDSSFMQALFQSADNGTLFTIKPFTTALSFNGRSLNFTPRKESDKGDYYIRLNTQTREIIAELNLNNFIPASYVTLAGLRNYAGDLLNRETSGDISFKYENHGEFDYSVSLQSGELTRTWQNDWRITDAFLIKASGDKRQLFINDFCLNASANSFFQGIVNFSGRMGFYPVSPAGTLSVEHLTLTGKESVTGIFDISTHGKNITVTGDKFSIGSLLLKKFEMFLNPAENNTAISLSGHCADGGAVFFDAVYYKTPRQLETSLVFDSLSLFNFTEIFRPFVNFIRIPAAGFVFTRNTLLDGEFFFSSDFTNIAYNAPGITLNNDGIIGLLSVSGTDKNFSLTDGIFYFGENEFSVSANANFTNPADIDFLVNANYLDVSWNVKGQILDRTSIIVDDPAGLHAYGSISNSGAVSGYIEGVDFPIPANVYPAFLNFNIALRYNSNDFWSVDIDNFNIRDLNTRNGRVNLSITGAADQGGAAFKKILYSDNIGNLSGNADFSWDPDFSNLTFIFNIKDNFENGEFCFLQGTLADKNFDINGSLSNIRVDRFVSGAGVMLASADVNISYNNINSFNANVDVSSFYARMRTNTVLASMNMLFSNENLQINNLNINYSRIKAFFPVFQVNIAEGTGKITADFGGYASDRRLNGKMNLDANFNRVDSWIDIKKASNILDGSLVFENFIFGDLFQDKVLFKFAADENFISFSGGVKDMIKMEMDRKGSFYASLSDPLPVRGAFSGVYNKGSMDAYCNDYFIDMASLWKLAANTVNDFEIAGGYVTGKMNLRGPVWNPEFYGTGTGTSLRFHVPNFISEDIRAVPFNILAQGYEMTFGPVVTSSGRGGGTAGGWFRFEYWVPRNLGLNVNIPRNTPVPYDIDIAGFIAEGNASGSLNIDLNSSDRLMQITGALFVNNTEMYVNREGISPNSQMDREDKYNTVVDISITSGSMVEFFWPNMNSPILRANPEMGTVFRISSDTQSGQYSLVSDVKIRSGELFYFDRNFYIRQGSLTFRENETQFNPRISARAEIRDRADSGPVTISMIIDNQPLLSFEPRFESSPGLTQLEIYTILGQNLYNVERGDDMTAQRFLLASSTDVIAQIVSGSSSLAQVLYFRQVERNIRRFLHLDMLSIRTRFFQNAVVSSSSAMFGQVPVDRISRVGNYFDNTTVFIGKYIGQDMFIQGNITLKFDENSVAFGGLKLEPDFEIEMQSPFLNIRWGFIPYHPQNWWVNDHSITLIWSKSF